MKNIYLFFVLSSILLSCNKESNSDDPCNISGKWRMVLDNSSPITLYGAELAILKNGDLEFSGLNDHQWTINNGCTTFTFWKNSTKDLSVNMAILQLDEDTLEMEMTSGSIALLDPLALLLSIDRVQFIRAQ